MQTFFIIAAIVGFLYVLYLIYDVVWHKQNPFAAGAVALMVLLASICLFINALREKEQEQKIDGGKENSIVYEEGNSITRD